MNNSEESQLQIYDNLEKPIKRVFGFAKPISISQELCEFLGVPFETQLSRMEVTKRINAYINIHHLQNVENRRLISPDSKLGTLLKIPEDKELTFFNIQRYLGVHYFPNKIMKFDDNPNIEDETKLFSLNQLAHMYLKGINKEQNYEKAFAYCQKSAEKGDSYGLNQLGFMYRHGLYVNKNNKKAFKYYQQSAEKGNPFGLFNLGQMYHKGYSVKKNKDKAFEYFYYSMLKNDIRAKELIQKKYFDKLLEKIQELETTIDCMPGIGKAFFESKKDFEERCENH